MDSLDSPHPDAPEAELQVLSIEYDNKPQLISQLNEPGFLENCCQQSLIGKKLPNALYVHISAIEKLAPPLRLHYERFSQIIATGMDGANIIKFHTDRPKISYLFYPDFDTDPHPALLASVQINLENNEISPMMRYRDYSNSDNPPILHRKETFVTPEYPYYQEFEQLTKAEEKLGLLDKTSSIGTRQGWMQWLQYQGVQIQGHRVVNENGDRSSRIPKIERHRAAIVRTDLSRPVRFALEANLFTENITFFDYGCGHGGDVTRIAERGYTSNGWDPFYFPNEPCIPADIINIGYVINVIEHIEERGEALRKAWELTHQVLLVSAQVLIDDEKHGKIAFGDGVITRHNTFQKYYEQEELKIYIDQVLGVDSIPVALGIYFVFRDENQAQNFRASRCRSRISTPRIRTQVKRFEDYKDLLAPLMAFVTDRGRLPVPGELPQEAEINFEFRKITRAFDVILQATEAGEWDMIKQKRRSDLLLYLALSEFKDYVQFKDIEPVVQKDIKALFGSYKKAREEAEDILFSLGDLSVVAKCCEESAIGHKRPNALFIHVSALSELDYRLRIYEGCASRTIGRMDEVTLIKFHTKQPKISYLFYPDFDTDPHPKLHTSMHIDLRDLHVSYRDYSDLQDPPVWHRKETVLTPNYPGYEKFAKLSEQEENRGLFDDTNAIKTLKGWERCLEEHCAEIRNYRLYWRKDADPYRVKLVRSAIRARKKSHFW
ncbi:DNA phosphorothioation-associated putative methyltransferase [Planktothrix sp. FACHB-1355]|uniref:DNA phosphorothioation-associated putative methyltransferase n=1 Tax=Aerosakkonema funiforme FACHB-1375 TaxID=2949571 RepID=A0A926VCN6_9CYAN|nr:MULTISPECIES: DNA phosphorothioation-associated putative methyltransferase [Oscillatoriales]MBD2181331.1 DNA phosphorothioation-associated putative methyltransferase [Aerosakkonema funiforme FACHB-1375]MBD3557555.1 DNA phosphorothioation-associated putative methyltransferase [Planktothrix sp. FACHB-1355]